MKQTDAGIEASVPAAHRDAADTIVKLELDAPAKDIPVALNTLLSLSADHTGSMRDCDIRQLEELGKLLRDAGLLKAQPAKKP